MSRHVNHRHLIAVANPYRKAHEKQPFYLHGQYNPTRQQRLRRNLQLLETSDAGAYCRRTTDRPPPHDWSESDAHNFHSRIDIALENFRRLDENEAQAPGAPPELRP